MRSTASCLLFSRERPWAETPGILWCDCRCKEGGGKETQGRYHESKQPKPGSILQAQRKARTPNPPDNTSSYNHVQLQVQITRRTWQTSRLPLGKGICADAGALGDVTKARPTPAYCEEVNCRSRPPSRKWDHGSGALCSASRGPPPSSCTSTGPEGPGSASRPRPHPRRRHRHHRCRCSRTPSRWPRCLRWGRCGRVCAGRLPVAARVLAVPAYVGARRRLHPAPDACDLSGTQLGGRCLGMVRGPS